MSAVSGSRGRRIGLTAPALMIAAAIGSAAARAETVNVLVDKAKVMRLPAGVATIVIGNPLIADASLERGGVLVLTGKGFGATNLLALDRDGRVVLDETVRVHGPSSNKIIVVYRGVDRQSYACAPECQPRITLGDSDKFFSSTLAQSVTRNGAAQRPAAGGAPPPQ